MNKVEFESRAVLPRNAILETIKGIRTALLFSRADINVVSFTSCAPGDGKSFLSFQVARSLAEANKRVLYLDADMRNSSFAAKYTKAVSPKGLSHYLSGQCDLIEMLYPTEADNLYIIFSGVFPPNPAELLGSHTFENLIAEARKTFDYVIVDTPPVTYVTDASLCVAESDGSILVLSSGKTEMRAAKEAKKILLDTGKPIIGCILNKIPNRTFRYGYGRYGGYGVYGKQSKKNGNKKDEKESADSE